MADDTGAKGSRGVRGLVRSAMLVGWSLVLWGSLILVATAWDLVSQGGVAALHAFVRLSPVNQLLAAAALVVWGLVAWAAVESRRARSPEGA